MKVRSVILLVALLAGSLVRAEIQWMDDFNAASKKAAEENKFMLLNFTGSDWCGWCIRLEREVFSQETYQQYAAENLVSVILDFPKSKELDDQVIKQNEELQAKFRVRGYPTILILSPGGELVQQTGYKPGGAASYVEHVQQIIALHQAGPAADPAE